MEGNRFWPQTRPIPPFLIFASRRCFAPFLPHYFPFPWPPISLNLPSNGLREGVPLLPPPTFPSSAAIALVGCPVDLRRALFSIQPMKIVQSKQPKASIPPPLWSPMANCIWRKRRPFQSPTQHQKILIHTPSANFLLIKFQPTLAICTSFPIPQLAKMPSTTAQDVPPQMFPSSSSLLFYILPITILAFLSTLPLASAQALNDPTTQYIEGRMAGRRIWWCPSGYGYLAYCPQPTDWDNYNWCCTFPYMGSWKPSCCPFAIPTGAVITVIIASIVLVAVLVGLSCWCCYFCPLYKQLYEYEDEEYEGGGPQIPQQFEEGQ